MAQPAGDEAGARAGVGDELQAAAMDRGDAGEDEDNGGAP